MVLEIFVFHDKDRLWCYVQVRMTVTFASVICRSVFLFHMWKWKRFLWTGAILHLIFNLHQITVWIRVVQGHASLSLSTSKQGAGLEFSPGNFPVIDNSHGYYQQKAAQFHWPDWRAASQGLWPFTRKLRSVLVLQQNPRPTFVSLGWNSPLAVTFLAFPSGLQSRWNSHFSLASTSIKSHILFKFYIY